MPNMMINTLETIFGKSNVPQMNERNLSTVNTLIQAGIPLKNEQESLHGQQAIDAVLADYKDTPPQYRGQLSKIVGNEGYDRDLYLDGSGFITTKVGQTGEAASSSPIDAIVEHEDRAKKSFSSYGEYPPSIQQTLIDAAYRGDILYGGKSSKAGQPQKWTKLANDGKWHEAADEHLDHPEYYKAKGLKKNWETGVFTKIPVENAGLVGRFEERADAMREYATSLEIPAKEAIPKEDAGFLDPIDDFFNNMFGTQESPKPKREVTELMPKPHKDMFTSFWDAITGD